MTISVDNEIIERLKLIFSKERYDYIHYSDPNKALNNVIEVDPDILIFNEDTFENDIVEITKTKIEDTNLVANMSVIYFSKDYALSLENSIHKVNINLNDSESINYLNKIFHKNKIQEFLAELVFTHPVSNNFILAQITKIKDGILEAIPTFQESASTIPSNTPISSCTLKNKDKIVSFSAKLITNELTMKFQVDKKILKKLDLLNSEVLCAN